MKKNSKFQPTISHLSPAWGTVNLPGSDISGDSGNSGGSGNSGSSSSSGGSSSSGKFWSGLSWDNALSTISGLFSFGGSYFDSKSAQYKSQSELARLAAEKEQNRTNYTPWIVGGVGLVVLVLVIILVARKK